MIIKRKGKETPAISTSSLPDIIFILLFFFMVATKMRETEVKVKQNLPKATETEKLVNKDMLSYIFIGEPSSEFVGEYGNAPRLQLGDKLADPNEVASFIENEKTKMPPELRNQIIMAIKCDKEADLGILTDVKTELRKANALKVVYIPVKDVKVKK